MADEETVGVSENTETKVWTTEDPAVDWARYEGQFDRIDKGVRHRLACLLVFDGFLIVALAGERSANAEFNMTFELLILWLGFVVSLVIHWSQYRDLCHRRFLCGRWTSIYPEIQPAPFGGEELGEGSPAFAPSALIALLSATMWIVMTGITLGSKLAPADMISLNGILGAVRIGVLIATGAALVAFYLEFAMFYSSSTSEKEPPRKW